MARKMERKSARILALILALIMLGSVFAYMSRGGGSQKREVELRLNDFREYVNLTPKGAYFIEYYNMKFMSLENSDPLKTFIESKLNEALRKEVFSRKMLEIPGGISKVYVAYYYGKLPLYFVDENMSKVYFASEDTMNVDSYSIKVRPGLALFDAISPIVLGSPSLVAEVVKIFEGKSNGIGDQTYPYLSRVNDSFYYAWFVYDGYAAAILRTNNTTVADFFFEGYRLNNTSSCYEKVWAVHFIGNYFFSKLNATTEYIYIKNFKDGMNVAVMGDKNFTKLAEAQPRILTYKITIEKPKE